MKPICWRRIALLTSVCLISSGIKNGLAQSQPSANATSTREVKVVEKNDSTEFEKWTKRLSPAFIEDARNICGVNVDYASLYKRDNTGSSIDLNRRYLVYGSQDRTNSVGLLEIKQGEAFLLENKQPRLKELEKQFGNSIENVYFIGPTRAVEKGCRVFDLLGVDEENSSNVKAFALYASVHNGIVSKYIVDGPGVTTVKPRALNQEK